MIFTQKIEKLRGLFSPFSCCPKRTKAVTSPTEGQKLNYANYTTRLKLKEIYGFLSKRGLTA